MSGSELLAGAPLGDGEAGFERASSLEGASWRPDDDLLADGDWNALSPTSICTACPHCLTINFAEAQACRECHASLTPPAPPDLPPRGGVPAKPGRGAAAHRPLRLTAPPDAWRHRLEGRPAAIGLGFTLGVLAVAGLAALRLLDYPPLKPQPATALTAVSPSVQIADITPTPAPALPALVAPAAARDVSPHAEPPAPRPTQTHLRRAAAPEPLRPRRKGLPPAQVFSPIWLNRPSAEDLARLYPARARRSHVQGAATLDCIVAQNGALNACAVISERPSSLGFGQAALKLASRFQAGPTSAAGWPTAGYRVRVPVEWR